ncbi:MAG TPA: diacylglycerol kinase family protein [Gemmatimonadaceae bacterium]|nr:diacylglycerol kinase family protein [Gemmatimonadaceae bacterium]
MTSPATNTNNSNRPGAAPIPAFLNPEAGSAAAARAALESSGAFDIRDADADSLAQAIRDAVSAGAKRILVSGGDGTVASAAGAVAGTDAELAVLAGGTLNHFAKDHGISTDFDEAVAAALGDQMSDVDVGYVNDDLFLNTFSVGMYVGYVKTRDRLEKRLGYKVASFLSLLRTFIRMWTMSIELEVEGQVRRYKTALVFVGVGERELKAPHFGGRVEGGRPGLHVLVVTGRRRARLVAMAMAAASRGVSHAASSAELDSFVVQRCTIRLRKHSTPIALDGEIKDAATPLELRLDASALKVVGAK